jgi:hypothetical protein
MQDQRINHREETGTRGNAEREHQDGGCSKPAVSPHHPRGKPKVLRQIREHFQLRPAFL